MYTVAEHLVAITGEEGVQVNNLQAILLSHTLLDGDDGVRYNRVADVVLIFTAVKKLKPCGSNFSPIFYILFRFY